jgi:hypothetical protein
VLEPAGDVAFGVACGRDRVGAAAGRSPVDVPAAALYAAAALVTSPP